MDLSRDPHRDLVDELENVHHKAVPQKFTKQQESFLNRRRHETATAEALINDEHSPDRFARLLNESTPIGGVDQNSLPPDPTIITNNNFYERSLAPSWLLILFVAPLIVVLLVWLLVLLRRRFEQIQHIHLVSQNNVQSCVCSNQQSTSGQVFQYPQALTIHHDSNHRQKHHPDKQYNKKGDKSSKLTTKLASKSSKPTNHLKTHNAGYLLESSSSGTSTSSSSTTPTSDNGSPAASPSVYNTTKPKTTNTNTNINATPRGLRLDKENLSCPLSLDPMHSLLKHMQLYLLTLTYQETIACLVAFTIAIMNIVRMRNLFCCNLIIFMLITSKFFNLLTLTAFSITKLIKLCNLKVCENRIYNMNYNTKIKDRNQSSKHSGENSPSQHHRQQDDRETIIFHSDDKKSEDSLIDRNTSSSYSSSSNNKSKRVIDDNSNELSEELFCFSHQDISCNEQQHITKVGDSNGSTSSYIFGSNESKSLKNNHAIREPIVCHVMLITIISSTLGLVCLYLRLMPLSGPLLLNSSDNMNKSSLNSQDWSISIYAPSTTTEASTRYSSSTIDESRASLVNNNNQNAQQQQQQPNYQATWSTHFQQSSQLKHFIDQYELQNFITLLTDTHLQTSRFMCTLAADNYAPFAKLSMMTLYASLMLLILVLSIVIRHFGRKRLRQFELACSGRGLGKISASNILLGNYPNCLNCNRNNHSNQSYLTSDNYLSTYTSGFAEFPMFLYGNASQQRATDSNRKRYSDLLKQNMAKQQQSSLDIYSLAPLRMPHRSHQSQKNKLRNSSSMSSLLVTQLDESAKTGSNTTAFSASVDRYPPVQLVNSSKPYKHQQHRRRHHQQQQQQQLATSRQTHLRRLITAQSMCNLAPNSAQAHQQQVVTNTKIPAGKLASSGGHLAWLPLGSAATVASLSNIGRDPPASTMEESEEDSWSKQLIATRLKLTDTSIKSDRQRVGNRRATGNRERLGSIGEHLVDCTSTLNEQHEKKDVVIESDLCGKNLNRLHGKNGMRGRITKKTSLNIETTTANIDDNTKKLNELSSSPSALVSSHYQQQQQQQQLKQRTGSWPLYSNQHETYQQNQYQCQQIDYHDGVKNRLNYEELKRDLRLSQAVILFGQLLNHAPILLLLAIAKFAPDGLIAGWNSSHDNGFIWLTLIEAFVFPLFLCAIDPSLTFALKRSLRCTSKSGLASKPTISSSTSGTTKVNKLITTVTTGKSHHQLAGAKLNFNASSPVNQVGTRLAHQTQIINNRQCSNNTDLILGSSASYPNFMFACQRNNNNRAEGYAEAKLPASSSSSSSSSTAPQTATNANNTTTAGHKSTSHQSFTGLSPPNLLITSSKQRELNIDVADDSLRANFALMTKDPLRNLAIRSNIKSGVDPTLSWSLVGTGDLLASRRARYNEFLSGRSRRKLRTSALLSATKKLLRFSSKSRDRSDKQQRTYKRQKQRSNSTCLPQVAATTSSLSFGYSNSNSNSSTADTNAGKPNKHHHNHQSSFARGRSPTSSLSTLIRKFNHDNYTNVCQQYEQRKQQIAVEENRDNSLERRHMKRNDSPTQMVVLVDSNNQSVNDKQEVLIDGLDGTTGSGKVQVFSNQQQNQQQQHQQKLEKDEQRNLLLVDEEGIFCRKGGLYYNYCLGDQTTPVKSEPAAAIQRDVTNSATSRINPMLQVAALKEQTNNAADTFNASSNTGSGFSCSNKAASERCLILEESFNERTKLDYSNVERLVNGKKEKQAPLDKNTNFKIEVKDSCAIKAEEKKKKTSTTNTTTSTNNTTTNIIPSKQSNGTKQNVNDSNNNETIISNITSVQELLNKMNGIMEKQQEFKNSSKSIKGVLSETCGRSSSSNSSGFESSSKQFSNDVSSKNGRNNKSILELVTRNSSNNNKESNKQSDTCANQVRQLTAALSSVQPKQQAVADFFDNSSSTFNYNTLDGGTTLDYASLRSVDDALSLVSVSSEFEYHNINHGVTQPVHHYNHHQVNSLEQQTQSASVLVREQNGSTTASSSTTIAVETSGSESVSSSNSTVSLKLSPESEFRTSSVTGGGDGEVKKRVQNATTSAGHLMISSVASSSNHSANNNNGSTYSNSSSGSNSSSSRRFEDLRFPSFLPTKSQLAEAVAAAAASENVAPFRQHHQIKPPKSRVIVSLNKQAESQKSTTNIAMPQVSTSNSNNKTNSSSLLNLTTAKFAVLNNHNNNNNSRPAKQQQQGVPKQQQQQQQHQLGRNSQLGCKLPTKVAGSSNTITKQKKSATNDHIVTLTEFNSRQSSNGFESNSDNRTTECSLPSESGNVRARIRKMEQQQSSTPNLANSSQKKQQVAPVGSANNKNNQRNAALIGSMIPVTSSSRLPVLTSSNLQLTAAARNNGGSSNRNQRANQTQRSFSSTSGSP